MDTQKVRDLSTAQSPKATDFVMLITNLTNNVLEKCQISALRDLMTTNSISDDEGNALTTGSDDKLYVPDLTENIDIVASNLEALENYVDSSISVGSPIIRLDSTLLDGEIRLEGATVSRTTYASLFAKYGTTYGAGDGSTTFQLPDFRNRAIWGADSFGYLSAGLPNITGRFDTDDNLNYFSTGAFQRGSYGYSIIAEIDHLNGGVDFDASRSSSIYGNSSTVQPPSIKVRVVTRYR